MMDDLISSRVTFLTRNSAVAAIADRTVYDVQYSCSAVQTVVWISHGIKLPDGDRYPPILFRKYNSRIGRKIPCSLPKVIGLPYNGVIDTVWSV